MIKYFIISNDQTSLQFQQIATDRPIIILQEKTNT